MPWNWQMADWPHFIYDSKKIIPLEKRFFLEMGSATAFLKTIQEGERNQLIVEILSAEGLNSSLIEGEILDRKSLQSSIQRHFGLNTPLIPKAKKEEAMAKLLCNVYETFDLPLTHEMLFHWHHLLFQQSERVIDIGKYRTHPEPMQIVSSRYENSRVFFETPPSEQMTFEMNRFLDWYNSEDEKESPLCKAAIAHVYFESIHPFEDGNGRIGRFLVEKILSQSVGQPTLIAVSKILEAQKKHYYESLGRCNKTLNIQQWIEFFANAVLQAQKESMDMLVFLIKKAAFLTKFSEKMNERQEKAILRMFAEGPNGFKGGLSAKNYISITKTSKATATRDLVDLVEKEALIKTGQLRHTRYWLNI